MNPSVEPDVYISKVTLGLLEDMGWYYIDYCMCTYSHTTLNIRVTKIFIACIIKLLLRHHHGGLTRAVNFLKVSE